MKPWLLGNTTVRSPFRLRDGLLALSKSSLQGNLRGKEQDKAFRQVLGEHGIVTLGSDKTNSVGRKWRSAMNQLGFLYPKLSSSAKCPQHELGLPDAITPNGRRLIEADTVPAIQECFLRALAAHHLPSPTEPKFTCSVFSPLRHTLAVMLELERQTGENHLDFLELAVVVQVTSSDDACTNIAAQILTLRKERLAASNKTQFDRQQREAAAKLHELKSNTFNDYADTNLRYLKATGLVRSKGRGIVLVPEKHLLAEKLVQDAVVSDSECAYFVKLCNGAALPTDSKDSALAVLDDLLLLLNKRRIPFDTAGLILETPADIAVIRHRIEELLAKQNEEEYAAKQPEAWKEIAAYMELIINRRGNKILSDGVEIAVPKAEAPAYFEWILWRAFLAVNRLVNKPYEARRFKIDQDFLPIGTSPGNGPDLIFEFDEFIVAVEVTLTENSRQEAAEGEPVRRHVADIALRRRDKPVYGLFIANRIDSNTAETFRIGVWFTKNDEKMRLDIIPITLKQFKAFFGNYSA